MRAITAALLSVAILISMSLLLAGCVSTTADGIQIQPLAGGDPNAPAAVLGIDPAVYVILDLERSGGLAGLSQRARLFLDGHVLLEQGDADPLTFQLSPAEQAQLAAALDAADFYRNAAQSTPPEQIFPDAFQYRILRRGVLLQGEVLTQDGSAPTWLQPLLPLLSNLLLTPDPARVQPYQPAPVVAAPTTAPTLAAVAPAAPAITLLEFVRSQAGQDVRVLVNLDRSYSVAREGVIREGELSRDEMSTLVRLLEAADLRARAGDYTPDEPCTDCARFELTYRNLLSDSTVRGEEGAQPEWLQVLTDALVDGFLGAETTTANVTSTATLPVVAATVAPPVTVATPGPTASPAPAAQAIEPVYTTQNLLADLTVQGAQSTAASGRITKPYLSVPGIIVMVNGQPLQVFQYADAAALAVDVAGLAPTASSINGIPLAWPAAPHFWRKDGLLVLAVTNDPTLVELVGSVMGPAFAGRP